MRAIAYTNAIAFESAKTDINQGYLKSAPNTDLMQIEADLQSLVWLHLYSFLHGNVAQPFFYDINTRGLY